MKSNCAGPPDAPLQWPGSRDSGLSALSPQQSVHRATQCDALSRVTRPRHEYVTSPAAGDTNLCRTQHPECALHKWYLWWRANIISILGGREFLRHCKRAGVEWVGLRPSVPGWRLSLIVLVWSVLCELRGVRGWVILGGMECGIVRKSPAGGRSE